MSRSPAPMPTASRGLTRNPLLLFMFVALAGCDTSPTRVDQHFGLAVQRAQTQQSLPRQVTPTGMGRDQSPCTHHGVGMGGPSMRCDRQSTVPDTDGAAVLSAVTRYQQSFQTPPAPAPVFNIGLGAVSAP